MPDPRDEFEEAWARIVEDLTRSDPDTDTDGPSDPAVDSAAGSGLQHDTGSGAGSSHDPATSAAPIDPGLGALFEPLRRQPAPDAFAAEQPPPDAFVDNWEDEGHFIPPEPPEIPEGTPVKRLAWAGVLGGPTILILSNLTGWDAPGVVNVGAGLAFLAGFATLVWLLPESREDGWDDGARL